MRLLYRVTLTLVMLALLAGCAGNPGAPPSSPTPTASPVETSQPAVVEIWHALPKHQAALSAIVDAFSQRTPTLNVRLQAYAPAELRAAYEAAVDSGGGPALIITEAEQHAALIAGGRLAPIPRALTDQLGNLLPRSVITAGQNETPYGVPFSLDFPLLFYDRVRVSTPPATLDDLKVAAADHGLVITPDLWTTAALHPALGEQLAAGALQRATLWVFFDTLASFAAAPGVRFEANIEPLTRREAGFLLAPTSAYLLLHNALGAELGIAPLPYAASGDPHPVARLLYVGFNINNTRAETNAAEQFVVFLLGEEAQRLWFDATGQPPVNPAGIVDEALRAAWRETVRSARAAPLQPAFFSTWLPALDRAILSLIAGAGDPVALAAELSSLLGEAQE